MKRPAWLLLTLLCLLTLSGCASLLDREYSTVEPHSQKYLESEDSSVLRAGDYQELVNDLLTFISDHTEEGTVRIYTDAAALDVESMVEDACAEVQNETALGAYAAEYITYTTAAGYGCWEAKFSIAYRRTAEQLSAVVNVTSTSAIESLLSGAAMAQKSELTLRIRYFSASEQEIRELVRRMDAEQNGADAGAWTVNFYPSAGESRIIEIILQDSQR